MYCLNMMMMALELARESPAYEDVASKFFEHFVYISRAMNNIGGEAIELWNREDGFYYDVLHLPGRRNVPLRVRSMVGLIPLFAVETLSSDVVDQMPGFKRRMQWFIENRPELSEYVETTTKEDLRVERFPSLVNRNRLVRVLESVEQGAEGENIRARIELLAFELLRRHVRERAEKRPPRGEFRLTLRRLAVLGDPGRGP
jgi:hypothetical protein